MFFYEENENGESAVNYKKYCELRFSKLKLIPDLCLYWCVIDYEYDFDDEETENELISGLYFLREKYPELIEKYRKQKEGLNKSFK